MTKTIAVVDYGMGNIGSVTSALEWLGGKYVVAGSRGELAGADAFILPGVGAFGAAMANLTRRQLVEGLGEQVLERKKPFLGICLGAQLVVTDSEEMGHHAGLGWVDGHVLRMSPADGLRVPHVGWNGVSLAGVDPLFGRIADGAHFVFDHSYHVACDPGLVVAWCEYGGRWVAALRKDNIVATQFHPEKSQRNGLKLLRSFLNIVEGDE